MLTYQSKAAPTFPSTRIARRHRRTAAAVEQGVGSVVVRHVQTLPTARRQAMLSHVSSATTITPSLRTTAQRFAVAIDANGDSGKPIVNRIDAKVKFAHLA